MITVRVREVGKVIGKSAFIFGLYHVRARRTSCDKIREKTSRLTAKINRMASKIEASFLLLPPKVFFSNYQFFVLVAKSGGFRNKKKKNRKSSCWCDFSHATRCWALPFASFAILAGETAVSQRAHANCRELHHSAPRVSFDSAFKISFF